MNSSNQPISAPTVEAPLRAGLERHITPAGNGQGVVTKASSDAVFGPEGLGFSGTPWTTLISWLARNGISEQTGSKPNETSIANCVAGWGQGAYSSHVFDRDLGVNQPRLSRLSALLAEIAVEQGDPQGRITGSVLAAFVGSQRPSPYSTVMGVRQPGGLWERIRARFRSHIQWQALYTLCGQVAPDGHKQVTVELLTRFFNSERAFFSEVIARRRLLKSGNLQPGTRQGPLCDLPATIDLERTDREYMKDKSGLWMILRIVFYMLTGKSTKRRGLEEPSFGAT